MPVKTQRPRAPVNDSIIVAVSRLVDDAQTATRELSHSDISFQFERAGLTAGDPYSNGQTVGKAKRVRAALSWALENATDGAEEFIPALISMLRAKGGFRSASPNYVGEHVIADAINAFRSEGFELTSEGELRPAGLDTLTGLQLTDALESYVRRAQRGNEDAALLVGTGKDLLEATAAHVISERFGGYPQHANFPTLLGQAFVAVGMDTTQTSPAAGEPPAARLQRSLYETGCAVNALRNRHGTGHGRPWLPTVSDDYARTAIQLMGIVAGALIRAHRAQP